MAEVKLQVVGGSAAGTLIQLEHELVFGRAASPPADLGGDPALSRYHARVRRTNEGRIVIEDLGSANGTYVNGTRINAPQVLSPGDRIELGDSVLQVASAVPERTQVSPVAPGAGVTRAAAIPPVEPAAPPSEPVAPVSAAARTGGPLLPPGVQSAPLSPPKRGPGLLVPVLAVIAVLGVAGAIVGFATRSSSTKTTTTTAKQAAAVAAPALPAAFLKPTVPPADLPIPAASPVAGWIYTESDSGASNSNVVYALAYGQDGSPRPLDIREWPTGGTGVPLVPGKSAGAWAGDGQVTLSPDHKLLFAVNQGSDTISVFSVNTATGDLTPVPGSPFPSGGHAPISVGSNGRFVVVANHGYLTGEKPPGIPSQTGYMSFSVAPSGALQQISTVPDPAAGPIEADLSPSGNIVFSSGFFSFKIHVLQLAANGQLTTAPGSPTSFPASVTAGQKAPPQLPPPAVALPFGLAVNPVKPYVYYLATVAGRVAVYGYDQSGGLTFVNYVNNSGLAGCWAAITSDGRFLYVANSGSRSVAAFAVSAAGDHLTQIQNIHTPSDGTTLNLAIDPTNRYLYVTADHQDPDFPRPVAAYGNFVDAFSIGSNGALTPIASVPLPVQSSDEPAGLAVLAK
ncbi:MAG TPA: beta-propeller fold lactonase family protein [Solirubrobacteraceae bacterium]|nr:beta-propeller fold lactonase family protein [Solirubrobacteraceae bacterium]